MEDVSDTAVIAPSPLLTFPDAVPSPENTPDSAVAWHYGNPFGEQRDAVSNAAVIDRSHRFVIAISGEERLTWLNTISSQLVSNLPDGHSAENLSLDVNGRVEHHFVQTDLDGVTWIDTEAAHGPDLLSFLKKMVFWSKAEPREGSELAVLSLLGAEAEAVLPAVGAPVPAEVYDAAPLTGGGFVRRMPWPGRNAFDLLVPRAALAEWFSRLRDAGASPAGTWTYEALRVESIRPRVGVDTDEKTIPHEVRWIGGVTELGAVHLEKGCYRGQETVARVHNLGRPPRHLVLLHLDGSADGRPATGDAVTAGGRTIGRLGTVVDHFELGPVALALVKRTVPAGTELTAGPCAASIDPDSIPDYDDVQAGRAAVDRLRGR
ncbi:MAG: folate-binding protein YgfZ [Rhodococcus fascians]|uniref:CAF17-like 4Fe-4S cluster assembly/insertion protein YgfZ n=1 Tax=Nocardiaceae TaxID=85025 RepID=UPI0003724B9F|nr:MULTISPECIES: folate-binding protein YgfZ [Rhodococcus]OZC88383.1 folate-binding protein [Rhodococcus sp. 06-418-1B]OZD11925.1 folate-binding protein [Rhodococcus sp. 06-156-4C]OZD23590.1 folate-binding protein [Rhodococcus sp. 06-156-4a]OZD26985.1 folate-binding protein [Rhodococcus sp. 06-156-3C]OZD29526.1 folate-binding protein [Rhodococcus sp. 06-156-3b]